jgi:hypothetical protein
MQAIPAIEKIYNVNMKIRNKAAGKNNQPEHIPANS